RHVRITIAALLLLAGIVFGPRGFAAGVEQTITPITPPVEQRIERLGGDGGQRVDALASADDAQRVDVPGPPTATQKAASTAGKFVVGVAAAGISVAAMAATLMFI